MSNLIKRTVPVILVLIVCITCLVSPVSADSFEFPELFYNVLDYASPNGFANNAVSLPDANGAITFEIPGEMKFNYVDIFVSSSSTVTSASINGTGLSVLNTSNNTFRIYGNIPSELYSELVLNLHTSSASVVTFFSFNAYTEGLNHKEIIGGLKVNDDNSIVYDEVQSSPGASLSYSYGFDTTTTGLISSNLYLSCNSWKNYDYIAFRFRSNLSINNIVAMTEDGDYTMPVYISNYNDVASTNDSTLYFCIIDVRSLPRTLSSSNRPILYVRGYHQIQRATSAQLYDTIGYNVTNTGNPVLHFLRHLSSNLEDWFSDLKSSIHSYMTSNHNALMKQLQRMTDYLMSLVTGRSDSDAISAQQKQEELNVSINNQLVGAVEDWNTNIEIVETGYDMAIANVSSPLVWLASLADGVFNGMGWFGNIYFLIGLISVIMLVLSKSGLARSIGRLRRD